jgi:hypothetical protein
MGKFDVQHLSDRRNASMMTSQRMRWMGQLMRSQRLNDPLSQLIWLVAVGLFFRWTQTHYHPPAGGVPWIGMTMHTSVFALWGQVAREWFAVRWSSRSNEQQNHTPEHL